MARAAEVRRVRVAEAVLMILVREEQEVLAATAALEVRDLEVQAGQVTAFSTWAWLRQSPR